MISTKKNKNDSKKTRLKTFKLKKKNILHSTTFRRITQALWKLLDEVSSISSKKREREMKIQSFKAFEKTICFEITSIKKFERDATNFSIRISFKFWNSSFIITFCSFFTKSICFSNRCCFAIASRKSLFNFWRCFFKRRQRAMFKEVKSHERSIFTHFVHLSTSSSTRQLFESLAQLWQRRMIKELISKKTTRDRRCWYLKEVLSLRDMTKKSCFRDENSKEEK